MASAALTITARRSVALSESRNLRFFVLFLLYFAQGLPFGLIDFALPAWLAQNGASAAEIGGVLAMIILPWTFKLAYGFIMDRYAFLAMGRRRPWIIVGQIGLVAAFVAMAIANPSVDQIGVIAALAFAMGLASAFQDVAVDGLAVDILPADEIERVNGYMFGGQAIGVAAGAALSGYLIAYHGLPAAALVLAMIIAAILLLVIVVRERSCERLLPWTKGMASQRNLDLHLGAFGPIVRNLCAAMFTRQTLILVPALLAITATVHRKRSDGLCRCSSDGGAAGSLGRPSDLDRRHISFHDPRFSQRCHHGFPRDAALYPGSCRDAVCGVHGDPQSGADDRLRLARLARQPGRPTRDVHGDDGVQPSRRRLCLCRESGAVRLRTIQSQQRMKRRSATRSTLRNAGCFSWPHCC